MDPVVRAALSSWDWRLEVIIPLSLLAVLYVVGWARLRRLTKGPTRPRGWALGAAWRPISYISGILVVGIALVSPIDVLVQQLFFVHMIQHLLLIMIAPPLLLLPNPLPFLLWGLPDSLRLRIGHTLGRIMNKQHASGRLIRKATLPGVVWLVFVITVFGWHDPALYDAALRSDLVHDIEHLAFFGAGMLFWWTVIGAGPRLHKQFGRIGRIAFVLAAIPPNMALGIVLAFINQPIYGYYEGVPRLWNIDVVTDQRISGIIMWIPGSMMYLIAALVLVAGMDRSPARADGRTSSRPATLDEQAAPAAAPSNGPS